MLAWEFQGAASAEPIRPAASEGLLLRTAQVRIWHGRARARAFGRANARRRIARVAALCQGERSQSREPNTRTR